MSPFPSIAHNERLFYHEKILLIYHEWIDQLVYLLRQSRQIENFLLQVFGPNFRRKQK